MNMERIKKYIMAVLIHKKDSLVICPTLVIDRLFDNLDLATINIIADYICLPNSLTPEIKNTVWDRYLMPRLAQADQLVKVFAR